jgi:predicted dehydrogenase
MAIDLTPEQKEQGRQNFAQATKDLSLSRRGFMKSMVAAGAVVPVSAAVYFGYKEWQKGKPVRAALIGCGDEGGVLANEHNPEFLKIVAVSDIRPFNRERIFEGDGTPSRKGLKKIYGENADKEIKSYAHYTELLKDDVVKDLGLEAVVIALPLHLHAPAAIAAMDLGLHVLCEKLMARNIAACKAMIKKAKTQNVILSIGHQRHYSMLYAHANEVVQSGILGDVKHIRALWHRNFTWPWSPGLAKKPLAVAKDVTQPQLRDGWFQPIYQMDYEALAKNPELWNKEYDSIEQLIRWRVSDKTGGGLMAELGSHQLDASSIFLGKVKPLAVSGVGGRFFFGDPKVPAGPRNPNPRESDDSVFVTFEFPGPSCLKKDDKGRPLVQKSDKTGKNEWVIDNPEDVVVVTYSSLNTNGFEDYGECLMGSRGTMVVEKESDVYLYKEPEPAKAGSGGRSTAVTVAAASGKPAMEANSTWAVGAGTGVSKGPAGDKPAVSRGYREEMEHFAFCVRQLQESRDDQVARRDKMQNVYEKDATGQYVLANEKRLPKCHGEVAMADAILALTANMAMDKKVRIPFEPDWFEADADAVPEAEYGKAAKKA